MVRGRDCGFVTQGLVEGWGTLFCLKRVDRFADSEVDQGLLTSLSRVTRRLRVARMQRNDRWHQ